MRHNELGFCNLVLDLHFARRRFAGVERGPGVLQGFLNRFCDRVRAPKHAPRGPRRVLECRRGLTEIVERGAAVL